jgi:transposase
MHIRVSTRRRGKLTYSYAQLVESYRREDGLPAHRILASLKNLSEQETNNLRLALQASREGKAVVVVGGVGAQEWPTRVVANLRYLDVAVALEMWRRWDLTRLFNRLLQRPLEAVPPSAVVAALVVQRCTDPGSKLYAQRWFPRTALPELLQVDLEQFNNTRIHRILNDLDSVGEALQADLPKRYAQKEGAFAAIFMDVTDAWFEGRGPELAERNRTKEGFKNRRKIGIVLVCNQDGYPLRWKVTPGKRRDPVCLGDMLTLIQQENWLGEVPLVCDRAMGQANSVAKLVESGTRFVTACPRHEIHSYAQDLPYEPFLHLSPVGSEISRSGEIEVAAQTAASAGLHRVDDALFVRDLGVHERVLIFERPRYEYSGAGWDPDQLEGAASFLALARIFQERIDRKEFRSRSDLAQKEGMTRARVTQIMNHLRLKDELQEGILRGEFGYVPERVVRDCVRYQSEAEQRRLLREQAEIIGKSRPPGPPRPPRRVGRERVRVRLVAYFNPEMFVEQRAGLAQRRRRVEDFVADLNRRLRSSNAQREKDAVRVELHNFIARWKLLNVYQVDIRSVRDAETGRTHLRVRLEFNQAEWHRRIRYAGFVLLIAHPDLPHSAEDIVGLYRQKDTVEKDFQTIKETVKLRPLYHHTDPKVRAHVTLCMLALLLERTIDRRLRRSGLKRTAAACFEELQTCHLNLIRSHPDSEPVYVATEATQEQRALLRSLRMLELIDTEEVASRIHPRPIP